MKIFFFNNHSLFFLKKFFIFYLIISNSIINSGIKIFPDHYEHGDEIFTTSQVNDITFERFYYDVRYFSKSGKIYRSPKYGIDYIPIECEVIDGIGELYYETEDRQSFFGTEPGKAIQVTDSTRSSKNKVEETKLYQNTMRGYNFRCPSPFRLFHTRDFEITYKLPMISDTGINLSVRLRMENNDGTLYSEEEICTMNLAVKTFDIMILKIVPKNNGLEGSYIDTEYICTNTNTLKTIRAKEPINFFLDFVPDTAGKFVILSNYDVTIEDKTIKTGLEYQSFFIRSRNGLNTCDSDEDCFTGFMCLGHKCLKCHSTCLRCSVDISESNARNFCTKCNALSVSQTPNLGLCEMAYVDMSQFENFEIQVKPDGNDFNDRETMGFWAFFANSFYSATNSGSIFHIVLKDRLVASMIPGNKVVRVYCHVFEDIFRHRTSDISLSDDYESQMEVGYYLMEDVPSFAQKQYMQGDDDYNIDGHWFHVTCAESFDHGLFYIKTVINGEPDIKETNLKHEPLYANIENDQYFRHIINDGDYLYLSFKNFGSSGTKIYLRNFILFKEYIPKHMQYMYFNFNGIADFHEILYQIPFDHLYYGTDYKIKGFAYKGFEEDIILHYAQNKIEDYSPPLNFKHLNLPGPNKIYKEIDLIADELDDLKLTVGQDYVYDDNLALSCKNFLDYESNQCNDTCINYNKIPFEGVHDKSGYCDYSCSPSMVCDYDHLNTERLDYNGSFCLNTINGYNLFFRCEDGQADYYMQFSGFYNSGQIDLEISPVLKSFIIEFWYYPDFFLNAIDEKLFQYPTYDKNYFFHSNAYNAYFLGTQTTPPVLFDAGNTNDVDIIGYQAKEWNKFIFYTKYEKEMEYYRKIIYTNHNMQNGQELTRVYYDDLGSLKWITFCEGTCLDDKQNRIHWTTGYYKNLRIWNGDIANPFEIEQYDQNFPSYTNRISSIIYFFPLRNEYISNNKLIDPKTNAQFKIKIGTYNLRKYNYSSKFDRTMALGFYGKFIDPLTGEEKYCTQGCFRCWDVGYCFECRPGYYLSERKCLKIQYYYFRSPNIVESTLDAEITRIIEMEDQDKATVTFWIKPIGFSKSNGITIFKIGPKLDMLFSGVMEETTYPYGLSLYDDNKLVANDQNFRDKIGQWTFISLAYHKEKLKGIESYFPKMMKFEINIESFKIDMNNVDKDLEFTSFIITKHFFGLMKDLKFYTDYIIGAIAFEKRKYTLTTPFSIPQCAISYFPPGNTNKGCFLTSYLKGSTVNDFKCVPDSNDSYDTQTCSLSEANRGPTGRCFNICMGRNDWGYCSCTVYNYNSQMIFKNENRNACRAFDYINFAKMEKVKIEGVYTAKVSKRYTMQFWMYAYNYVNGKFGGITFFWNGHNKLIVRKGAQSLSGNNYEFTCIPYVTEDYEATISQTLIITINQWNFLSCAVDFPGTAYYINTNTNRNKINLKKSNLDSNEPTSILTGQTSTYLTISDDTEYDDWGYLFFKQIRLWGEAYFNAEFLSRIKIETKTLFPYLLQQWEPIFIGYRSSDFFKNFIVYELDNSGKSHLSFTISYTGQYGSNIIDEEYYEDVPLCSENGQYYDVTLERCVQFTDLSKMKDFEFNNLPTAYSGSYSMAFWIFIEDSSTLSGGIHINWSLHMQITVIKTTRLMGYCFPQGYYSDSMSNDEIITKLSNSLNAAEVYLVDDKTSESGTWIYVICGMSHYNRKFYINGIDDNVLVENKLNQEILYQYGSTAETIVRTSAPMRYFMSNTKGLLISTLKIINITNTKKIYFRQITLFRDYIDYWYSKSIRYMNLALLDSNKMQSVLFFVNFAEFDLTTKRLLYYHQYRRRGDMIYVKYQYFMTLVPANEGSTFELSANFIFLPLCEIGSDKYMKYDPEKNICVPIENCDLVQLKGYYCSEENRPLSCEPGQYIDLIGGSEIVCNTVCNIDKSIRQPGAGENQGICNSYCPENVAVCPSSNLLNYVSGFNCMGGFYRIAYQCYNSELDANSALFFSKCYNSPNFFKTLTTETQNTLSYGYFYEFWFKLDHMLTDCKDIEHQPREFYLYSTPHSIYLDTTSNLFYYEIIVSTSLNAPISGISDYEWNKIIIRTSLDSTIGQNVDVFLNFDLNNPVASFSSISSSIDMKLQYISFCSRAGSGDCTPGQSFIYWGSAYYRNIRIWEYRATSLEMIEDFNAGLFEEYPQSLILFYPLTIQYMDTNVIREIISEYDSLNVTHLETNNFQSKDDNVFYNYELNFDWGANNLNNYITSLDKSEEKWGYIESAQCHSRCKRCYSSTYTNCYECNVGFKLINKECVAINGYYLKIPANSPNTIIPFKLEVDTLGVPSLKQWTFCIYMKFEGVALRELSSYAKIIVFKESSYIAFDAETTNLVFVVESQLAFRDTNFNKYIGTWIPLCVANYLSSIPDTFVYPNMILLNVNKIDIPFVTGYTIPDAGFLIDQVSLHYETIALFADFRIYNKFIEHNFATMISSTANAKNLFIHYDLYSGKDSCIQLDYLAINSLPSVNCIEDYNIYMDSTKFCNSESDFFDVSLRDRDKPCDTCVESCVTLCNNQDIQECTCDMTDGLYWLRRHLTKRRTYCEYLPFIDFSVLNDINIKVPSSATYESTLEVYFYVYIYNTKTVNFKEMDIIWNKHNRITIYTSNNSVYARCYALWDIDNPLRYDEYIELSVTPYSWNNLRCGSEFISHKHSYFFNSVQRELLTEDLPINRRGEYSNLLIASDPLTPDSFGFVFLRQLKLWQQYNYKLIDTSHIDLVTYGYYSVDNLKTSGIFPGLISFFKNKFFISEYDNVKTRKQYKIINEVIEENNIFLPRETIAYRRNTFIGYNWVDPDNSGLYSELVLCEEGLVYIESKDTCIKPAATHCSLPADSLDNCMTCDDSQIYIHPVDGSCLSECPDGYYPRDDLNECRICDITCYTCTGPLYNECTSCDDVLNYVPDLHICILICQDYGLTQSPVRPNLCVIFDADAELVNVQEGVPIDVYTFEHLVAEVTKYTSKDYVTKWVFDPVRTRKENNDTKMEFPSQTPFNGDITKLDTSVDKNFFELGKKYAVNLEITSENEREPEKTVTIVVPFVLTMNSFPVNGTLEIFPEIGFYNTTTFVMTASNWIDDTTDQLEYKFYAIERGTAIIKELRNWSYLNEVTSNFTVLFYQNPSSNITIYCEIRDNYNATIMVEKDIVISNNLTNEIYTLEKAVIGYELPEVRSDLNCYFRSQYLMSLGIDSYKSVQPARLQTEFSPLLDGTAITQTDPKCTIDFCNQRGECELLDVFINCFCYSGYFGRNCHLDMGAFQTLEKYYKELYNKLMEDLQNTINYYQFKVFHNLYFGASQFFQDTTFFSINLDTFIELAMSLFPNSIYNNTAEYFDLLDFYFSYEVTRLEQQRLKIKNETGLPYRNISIDDESMEEYKEAFTYINEELVELCKYVATLYDNSDKNFTYDKNNFYLAIIPLTPTFDDVAFFSERKKKYKTNIDFMKCLNYIEVQKLSNPFYQRYMIFIEYYFFPFGYNNTLLEQNISPMVELRFYDIETGKDVTIQDCFGENALVYYLPFKYYPFIDIFNYQKNLYDPNQYYPPYHPIFRDPIYIDPKGIVTDDTVEERIEKYNRLYNISPKYFNEIDQEFKDDGLIYLNFTNDTNFVVFTSSHLSEFTSFLIKNNASFVIDGRFYYLFRPQIFKYLPNFIGSKGSLIFLVFFVLYIFLVIFLACYDRKYTDRETVLDFIKNEIAKLAFHYQKEKEYLAQQLIPNDLKNDYDPNMIEARKKTYGGPRGFDGALATGVDTINDEDDIFNLNKISSKYNSRYISKYNDDKKNQEENLEKATKNSKGKNSSFFSNHSITNKFKKLDRRQKERIEEIKRKKPSVNHLEEEFEDAEKQRETELQEYADLNLTAEDFFKINYKSRNIIINTLGIISIFHPRWKKLTMLMTEIALILLSNSVFLTLNEKVTHKSILRILVFSIISTCAADFMLYLLAFFFVFPPKKIRRFLHLVKGGGHLIILKEWEHASYIQGFKALIGYIICFILWILSFYVTFGFTVVWKYQNTAFYVCLALSFILDFVLFELIIEGIIALFFNYRREIKFMRIVGEFLNRLRNYRCMSP